jgi:hypothetical protein
MNSLSKNSICWLFLTGLSLSVVSAILEITAIFRVEQDWGSLLSLPGLSAVILYIAFLILGLISLFHAFLGFPRLQGIANTFERLGSMRLAGVAVFILFDFWFYLYSPWQAVLAGPWLQLIFSLGLAAWIALMLAPHRQLFTGWEEFILTSGLFLFPRMVQELRVLFTQVWAYRFAVLLGYFMILVLAVGLFSPLYKKSIQLFGSWRDRMGWVRWIVIGAALFGPVLFYILAGAKTYGSNPNIRFFFLLIELFWIAVSLNIKDKRLVSLKTLLMGAFALALISTLISALVPVTDYPFSMSWSEGDRFYEDSLLFGQHLYNYSGFIVNPYNSPGAYFPPGVFFLFTGWSIGLFRLWNALLLVVPPVLVAWVLARRIPNLYLRIGFILWITLFFILDAPLHTPFLLAAMLVFAFMFSPSPLVRGLSLAVASFYVGLSRWTWIPVTAGWGILIDLVLYYPHRSGSFIRRLAPTLLLALVGFLPGLATFFISKPNLGNGSSLINHQPLLWYRLLPNPTLPLGVLLTAILYSGPMIIMLIWWMVARRWRLDWLQLLAVWGGLAIFFIGGLVVSSKIGGGGDLHNLDMYLMTLMLVFMLGIYNSIQFDSLSVSALPGWVQAALCLMIILPLYSFTPLPRSSSYDPLLSLPNPQQAQQELSDIKTYVSQANRQGLVLFIDQRQLLTFNYVDPIPLVPDYEKKYMMDQAMAGNAAYFHNYYHDLSNQRFSLIVTEVLRLRHDTGAFSDENNDWVDWVSKPTLCFYQPLATYNDINVQLLVPRQNLSACQKYLK